MPCACIHLGPDPRLAVVTLIVIDQGLGISCLVLFVVILCIGVDTADSLTSPCDGL